MCIFTGNSDLYFLLKEHGSQWVKIFYFMQDVNSGLARADEFKWQRSWLDMFLTMNVQMLLSNYDFLFDCPS